ncbi:hypothetical protein [Thalassotalea fusca]
MRYRIEILVPVIFLGYIAFFPLISGEITHHFLKSHILVPFVLILVALTVLSFGLSQLGELIKSIKTFFVYDYQPTLIKLETIKGAIVYCYSASILWCLYAVVMSSAFTNEISILIPDLALSLTYGFIVAEFILRPLGKRINFLQHS